MTLDTTGRLVALAAAGVLFSVVGTPAALAVTGEACSTYSGTCDDDTDGDVGGPDDAPDDGTGTAVDGPTGGTSGGDVTAGPDSLPLTGGEATLLALTGVGTLAGGVALVVASRRRSA